MLAASGRVGGISSDYVPMLSTFHVTVIVWLPERFTDGFAASVNVRPDVLQFAASAAQVATSLYDALLSVPAAPAAFVHDAAFQLTSPAAHVVAPPTGGVKDAAFACSDTLSCLLAVARTMFVMLTDAALALVDAATFVTLRLTPAGTLTAACSLTFAVRVVV